MGQVLLPAVVLGTAISGLIMRMTQTMMLEVLRQDYIRTAWSKGLRERLVAIRHAVKNTMIPVLTLVALPEFMKRFLENNIILMKTIGALRLQFKKIRVK